MLASLRARLVFSHLIVIVIAMGVAGLLLLSFLEAYFLRSTEDSLIAQARLTVQAIAPDALTAGPPVAAQAPLNNAIQQQSQGYLYVQTAPTTETQALYDVTSPSDTLAFN